MHEGTDPESSDPGVSPGRVDDSTSLANAHGPKKEPALSRQVIINGEPMDIASDWHFPIDERFSKKVQHKLLDGQQSEVFVCSGDIFDTPGGDNSSELISSFLNKLATKYEIVVFTPGNHDLRGRDSPWDSFACDGNVLIPRPEEPISLRTSHNRFLIGNLFYDLAFIDPGLLDLTREQLDQFYARSNDGAHFLHGRLDLFPTMTKCLASSLTPEVDVVVTHALPHPSLVTFRVESFTPDIEDLARSSNLNFVCDPEGELQRARRDNITPEEVRKYWNLKSFVMGSNLLEHPAADPKDGLVCIYGHNHRGDRSEIVRPDGKKVAFLTHQPHPGKADNWRAML